jgi:hypothetical protein
MTVTVTAAIAAQKKKKEAFDASFFYSVAR